LTPALTQGQTAGEALNGAEPDVGGVSTQNLHGEELLAEGLHPQATLAIGLQDRHIGAGCGRTVGVEIGEPAGVSRDIGGLTLLVPSVQHTERIDLTGTGWHLPEPTKGQHHDQQTNQAHEPHSAPERQAQSSYPQGNLDDVPRSYEIHEELVDYLPAWELQRQHHAEVVAGGEDRVLLLEHPPVYTAGKRTEPHERPTDGTPVIDVDRGGKITFHGPGQLVGYPIVRLPDHVLVVDYVRRIEEALIRACAELGVETARVPGRSGVWLQATADRPERKIAAIGIRVARGVAMHGFALNCNVDLAWYDRFIPCGISDAGVTTLSEELGREVTTAEVIPVVRRHLDTHLDWAPYTPTPDYDPRPDPAKGPRVAVLNPLAK
jgi:lipoyl(octanoyl) transferase